MILKVIGTGSSGNAYLLIADSGSILMIECGMRAASIKQAINFDLTSVVGCVVTHEHNDHSMSIKEVMSWGVNVYASAGTLKAKGVADSNRAKAIQPMRAVKLGDFKVIPFCVKHDAAEPFGFVIEHEECGRTLFMTDTYYCEYTFPGLNNIIIEANYAQDIVDRKMLESGMKFLRDRVMKSHFSLENCKGFLSNNNLTRVNNIVLIHLSGGNSDEKRFKKEVQDLTGKTVHVADNGLIINLNKTPF